MDDFKINFKNNELEVILTIRLTGSVTDVLFIDAMYNGKFLLHDTFHMDANTLESIVENCNLEAVEKDDRVLSDDEALTERYEQLERNRRYEEVDTDESWD